MILAKVIGNVVSTEKHHSFNNQKILIIQPLDKNLKPQGKTKLAVDSVQAGPGDIVLVNQEGGGCRQILADDEAPVNSLICGIVDQVNLG